MAFYFHMKMKWQEKERTCEWFSRIRKATIVGPIFNSKLKRIIIESSRKVLLNKGRRKLNKKAETHTYTVNEWTKERTNE